MKNVKISDDRNITTHGTVQTSEQQWKYLLTKIQSVHAERLGIAGGFCIFVSLGYILMVFIAAFKYNERYMNA